MLTLLDTIINYSFYLLFFLVPLIFTSVNSELFEYNKMMLTYGITIIIAAAWLAKMIIHKKFLYRHTFLEIPLLLYLASHVLSTIFSIDAHVSIWGYYSRFHEGLLATISYLTLYFAAVSNLNRDHVIKILKISFVSAAIVSIYGIFEHFGHSASCFFITGNFDVSCWVQDVKDRVFATLGQPNWMAAYLNVLILITLAFTIKIKINNPKQKINSTIKENYYEKIKITIGKFISNLNIRASILAIVFLTALLFTNSRSGFVGLAAGLAVLALLLVKIDNRIKIAVCTLAVIFGGLFAFHWYQNLPAPGGGITDSEAIRKPVWEGAIKVWQRYPIFGSGVETFAYSFYLDRPASKNLDSEWDFLYNKAHNEYLNILATTGTVGFVAYLGIILTFVVWIIYNLQFSIFNQFSILKFLNLKNSNLIQTSNFKFQILALFAAWISILVTNFFGFSVVIIGLYFFLIPAFAFILISEEKPQNNTAINIPASQWPFVGIVATIGIFMESNLVGMWQADVAYSMGKNLDSVQSFARAYPYLANSVQINSDEPTYHDELSFNEATLATSLFSQLNSASASAIATMSAADKIALKIPLDNIGTYSVNDLVQKAITDSNSAITTSPNSLPFWKTRTKTFYTLATVDNKYILESLTAIEKAAALAPTDAKVHYNLGLLLGRTGQLNPAIKILEETVALKANYRDAYYALGLYYKEAGNLEKARAQMQYILKKIGPDSDAQKFLDENK